MIAYRIERRQHISGQAPSLFENRGADILGRIGKAFKVSEVFQLQQFIEDELHVTQWCGVGCHGNCPLRFVR
ncbi:hypothetical protein D3C77_334310 [compost metagenome]